jgi:hypothetical protein
MKMLSNAKAPLMMSCPAFGEFSFTPGDSVPIPWSVREVASASTSSFLMFSPTVAVASGAGTSPTTRTCSLTFASCSVASSSTAPPSGTVVVRSTVANDGIVMLTV